ncbi:MAG: phage holin family protein [Candidatus Limnocylindrales bacterium]
MGPLAVRVVINAIAFWVAVRIVPNVTFPAAQTFPAGDWWKLLVIALIFGLINAYLKPLLELLSLPARILTLGLFGLVINAVLLLLLAVVSDALSLGFKLSTFPAHLSLNAFVAALLASIVISIVSAVLAHFLPDRTSWRSRLHL